MVYSGKKDKQKRDRVAMIMEKRQKIVSWNGNQNQLVIEYLWPDFFMVVRLRNIILPNGQVHVLDYRATLYKSL